MRPCQGVIGKLVGHKYQGRYTVEERKSLRLFESAFASAFARIEDFKAPQDVYKKTYHGDVCPRCGDIINTPEHA
jgi:hypothetical protein